MEVWQGPVGEGTDVTSVQPLLTLEGFDPLPADDRYGTPELKPSAVRGTWAFEAYPDGSSDLGIMLECTLQKSDPAAPGPATRAVTLSQSVTVGAVPQQ